MNNIVYVMNVDWNWIKQRPHFVAELLNQEFNVHVMYQHRYSRIGLQQRNKSSMDLKSIYVIPRGDRYKFFSEINKKIKCIAIKREIVKTHAGILYLTFPNQIIAIPKDYKGIVVYDCMDNHPAFVNNEIQREKILQQEKQLIERAEIILVSSNNLISVLKKRYGNAIDSKLHLIRNGYSGNIVTLEETEQPQKNELYTFAYFGTISSWFNFDYILRSLIDFQDIQYELFGPLSGVQIPKHERIHYHGTVEHDKLLENVKNADCLIMPFVVNEIIQAVDPVKLYEYINFDKNILVSRYEEIERFSPFVHFYSSYTEFKREIHSLKQTDKVKYSDKEREEFLKNNSWNQRVESIIDIIKKR